MCVCLQLVFSCSNHQKQEVTQTAKQIELKLELKVSLQINQRVKTTRVLHHFTFPFDFTLPKTYFLQNLVVLFFVSMYFRPVMCLNDPNTVINALSIVPSKTWRWIRSCEHKHTADIISDVWQNCYFTFVSLEINILPAVCFDEILKLWLFFPIKSKPTLLFVGKTHQLSRGCRWLKLDPHLFSVHRLQVSKVFKNTVFQNNCWPEISLLSHLCSEEQKPWIYLQTNHKEGSFQPEQKQRCTITYMTHVVRLRYFK